MWLVRHELCADYECWIILHVTHLLWSVYASVSCLFSMCILCYVLNICCFITNEHCMTRKCFVWPQYLSFPQESRTAGFGRPNCRQGITKCRAPDFTNKCRHPFWVQTVWAHFVTTAWQISSLWHYYSPNSRQISHTWCYILCFNSKLFNNLQDIPKFLLGSQEALK